MYISWDILYVSRNFRGTSFILVISKQEFRLWNVQPMCDLGQPQRWWTFLRRQFDRSSLGYIRSALCPRVSNLVTSWNAFRFTGPLMKPPVSVSQKGQWYGAFPQVTWESCWLKKQQQQSNCWRFEMPWRSCEVTAMKLLSMHWSLDGMINYFRSRALLLTRVNFIPNRHK